jgi:hypothetical protein
MAAGAVAMRSPPIAAPMFESKDSILFDIA